MPPSPRPPRLTALRLLLPYLAAYRARIAAAGAALLVAALLVLGLGLGVKRLIDTGFAHAGTAALNHAALLMFGVITALAGATFVRFYLVSWLGERVAADLRAAMFNHVISLSPAFLDTARAGDVLARMTADVAVLQALIGWVLSQWLRNAVMLAGALVMLVVTSPKLAGIVIVVAPVVVVPIIVLGRRGRRLSRGAQDRVADLTAYAEETLAALRTVQAYTHEAIDRRRFGQEVARAVEAALRRVRASATVMLLVILLGFGAITFSLWVGGRDVIAGRLSGGELSAFIFYAVLVASSGAMMSELWGELQRAAGAAERIGELLAERPAIVAPADPQPLPRPMRGEIRFEAVDFCYPTRPGQRALAGLSLTVAPGETVALVGPSGAGKTTMLQLLLRFYDPQAGRVRIDGIDIARLDPAELRGCIALVAQEPVIFGDNAWENIRYGRPEASDAEVRAAARAAAAEAFLDALPEGFDTFLGEKGVQLSGGQRQRIAIARAILRDPPILLLDEATSALDAENEQAVQHALAAVARGRTTLVVAHRLATVRRADRIVVLDAGRVVAQGTHAELIGEGGLYARLAALQFTDA
ncbi:MAG: ATP-binding cassette domain-containing protein [Rhodospirillales bacterium]|nr:ATP-binding cassette domain-containing protein [Rhodospirillales bacterium]MDE2575651.1 ATP-binding cassette domain-containing protein [Rhodospirillales bacterium]